ncbi:hypothetical protein [Tateyamaria sp.]
MTLGLPGDLILEDEVLNGKIDLKVEPADWQIELAKSKDSTLIWWDLSDDLEVSVGCGLATGKTKDDMTEVRPFRNPRTDIHLQQIIGALDHRHALRQLAWLDGEDIDYAVSVVKIDRAWLIKSEPDPFIAVFSPTRWSFQNDIERRKNPPETPEQPAA